jgi:hypothetical protein
MLNRAGFNVTVYEKNARFGGLLRYGIPDFKLEKLVIEHRLQLMRQEGVAFECCVDVGRDVSYRFLRDRFDAIVLATGAGDTSRPARARPRAGRHPLRHGLPDPTEQESWAVSRCPTALFSPPRTRAWSW